MKKEIIKKWYGLLNFPSEYDADFLSYIDSAELDGITTVEEYCADCHTSEENLLAYLYFCEALSVRYEERGIPREILLDTLGDIVVWCGVYHSIRGRAGLGEVRWLCRHLTFRLFKLGRLQFCMANAESDDEVAGIRAGEGVMEIHIPAGEPMTPGACEDSIRRADEFFKSYFPSFEWQKYTCHSWMLDSGLSEFLPESSNIIAFGRMFTLTHRDKSDAILKYVFRHDARRHNLSGFEPRSSFAKWVKERVIEGGDFYEGFGYRVRQIWQDRKSAR